MLLSKHAMQTSFTGSTGILAWRTANQLRITAASENTTLSLDVEAATELDCGGNGGIRRVYYELSFNGAGVTQTIEVFSAELRQPNSFIFDSPLPGAPAGLPAPYTGWGSEVNLLNVDPGYIDIVARVETMSGDFGATPVLRVYNDTDGIDRRPSQANIFVDEINGTPTGIGSPADPCQTLQEAIELCIPNSSEPLAAHRNCGGAVINVMSDLNGAGGDPAANQWHTDGHHLTIRAVGGRRTWRVTTPLPAVRVNADKVYGANYLTLETNVTIEGFDIEGLGFYFDKTGGITDDMVLRDVDCHSRSEQWFVGLPQPSVEYVTDDGQPTVASGATGTIKESWGHTRIGTANGLLGYSRIHDAKLDFILNEALDITKGTFCFTEIVGTGMRKDPGEVAGWHDVTGGVEFTVSVPSPGVMRLQSEARAGVDLLLAFLYLLDSTTWGIKVTGATNAGTNVSAGALVGVGYNAQQKPYLDITNATVVAETMTAAGRVRTARLSDGAVFDTTVDPSMLTTKVAVTEGAIASVSFRDCVDVKGITTSGFAVTRFSIRDFMDGSPETGKTIAHDFSGATFTHVLMQNVSLSSPDITFGASTFTGSSAVDCVFGFGDGNFITGFVSACHFVTGTLYGIYPTSGPFFVSDPGLSPFTAIPIHTMQKNAAGRGVYKRIWDHQGPRPTVADWVAR
jgi:hypothetical protein